MSSVPRAFILYVHRSKPDNVQYINRSIKCIVSVTIDSGKNVKNKIKIYNLQLISRTKHPPIM